MNPSEQREEKGQVTMWRRKSRIADEDRPDCQEKGQRPVHRVKRKSPTAWALAKTAGPKGRNHLTANVTGILGRPTALITTFVSEKECLGLIHSPLSQASTGQTERPPPAIASEGPKRLESERRLGRPEIAFAVQFQPQSRGKETSSL